MESLTLPLWGLLVCICVVEVAFSLEDFHHEQRQVREDFGDEIYVKAKGQIQGIIDLDDKSVVKRILCKELTIKVSLNDPKKAQKWRPGDVVIGSSDLGCSMNSPHPDRPGIYAKVVSTTKMRDDRVDLVIQSAKPLDMINNAKISIHVKRDTAAFLSRHKRAASSQQSIANFLANPLNSINFDKDIHTAVPFNANRKVLTMRKLANQKIPEVLVEDNAVPENSEFNFTCKDCFGDTTIAYHLEMEIKKDASNKPQVKKYISQIEGRSTGHYDFSIQSTRELTLSHSAKLWETPPIRTDILTLVRFKRLPDLELEVNTSSAAYLSVYATTAPGNVSVEGNFDTDGNYAVSKEYFSSQQNPQQQASVSNWHTVLGSSNKVKANTTFYYNVNVSQEIFVESFIGWAKKDVHMDFSSPFKIRFDQGIVSSSRATVSALQNQAMSNITGYFDTSDNKLEVSAFGIRVWDVMLAKEQHQTETHITKASLFSKSKANCFGDPSALDTGTCSVVVNSISRSSEDFLSLRKIFGDDLVMFSDDDNKTSTWCGEVGRPCTSCDDFEADEEAACANRLMTSSMATAVTKLAKFVKAEWPDRKLIILDAWTEPTSQYPEGKFGNSSLFNEGRAVRLGISKTLASNSPVVETENDAKMFARLKELIHCAGFPFADIDTADSVFEVCVSGDAGGQTYSGKKRRRRKRAIVSNNYAISDDWLPEKEEFVDKLIGIPDTITVPSTIPNYFPSGSVYPAGKTAEFMCGKSDEDFKRENTYQMKKLFQYPFDNIAFEDEGPSSSWCGTETRQCKQCANLQDSEDPMDWCESRIMNARLITRAYRLTKLVEKKVSTATQSTSTDAMSITLPSGWTKEEYSKCRNGPAYGSLSVATCKQDMGLTDDQCRTCIKERKCCLNKCLQGDCADGVCTEKNPFIDSISTTPKCDATDEWKMVMYDNVCSGDPCMFLNGAGYFVLLKILLLYEVCSPLRKETEMETWMANTRSEYQREQKLETFFNKCIQNVPGNINILKLHKPGGDWDDTIGVGFSLRGDGPQLFRKTFPDVDFDKIMDGSGSITSKQALYLFGIVTRSKLISLWSTIRYDKLALLPTNVKIAIFNANYRGDFGDGVSAKFKRAIENDNWEAAVSAYLSHSDYKQRCLPKGTHDICKRYQFNVKQFRTMIKTPLKAGDPTNNRRRRSTTSSAPSWFEDLRQAGRAAKFAANVGNTLSVQTLANLAVIAGFDFVEIKGSAIYTGVKATSGTTSQLMQYPRINMHGVDPPTDKIFEYLLSPYAEYALAYPMLIDGDEDLQLSDCYKVSDFKARNFRYFRIDTNLLECLDLASDYYEQCIKIVPDSAYRPHSLNNENIDDRHEEEKWRFNVGMAVEIKPPKASAEELESVALTVMRSCTPGLRLKRMKLGMGTHKDRVYVDIRQSTDENDIFQLWNVQNNQLYQTIKEAYDQLLEGGPFIQPTNMKKACKEPPLGEDSFYIKDPTKGFCLFDFSRSFCEKTTSYRQEEASRLAEELSTAAGSNQFPISTSKQKVQACLVETCGGCIGKGDKWAKKTKACLDLIQSFLTASSTPFPKDTMRDHAAFFNIENPESHVHSLACHDGNACIENAQLHSMLLKTANVKYKPDPEKSNEELLFDPGSNPTPILDLLEQEMAMKVSGNVTVYIEKDTDMSSFYHLIKILMVYNRNVGFVNFHLTKDVKEDRVIGSIQRKIERWASSACPKRTRMLVAPYDVEIISEHRRKRSLERSAERNKRISDMRNWEMHWLMTMT